MDLTVKVEISGNKMIAMLPDIQAEYLSGMAKKNGNWLNVSVKKPFRSRTTGPFSQNNHIWGHVVQIAKETGNDIQDVLDEAKLRAIKRGYPYKVNALNGAIRPAGTEELSREEAAYLIEELHMIAVEMDMILKEE
jgi:hypothetical protein